MKIYTTAVTSFCGILALSQCESNKKDKLESKIFGAWHSDAEATNQWYHERSPTSRALYVARNEDFRDHRLRARTTVRYPRSRKLRTRDCRNEHVALHRCPIDTIFGSLAYDRLEAQR